MAKIVKPVPGNIQLNQIQNHKLIVDRAHLFNENNYLLKSFKTITPDAVKILLALHPINIAVQNKRFVCFSGIRQLNIATSVLGQDASIEVQIWKGLEEREIAKMCLADLFLTPLILSVDNAHVIDEIRLTLDQTADKWTDLAKCPKNKLAKALGLSPAALYYGNKPKKTDD